MEDLLVGVLLAAALPLPSLEGEEMQLVVQQMPWFGGDEDNLSSVNADFFQEAGRAGIVDTTPGVAGEEFFSCVWFWFRDVSMQGVFYTVDSKVALKAKMSGMEQWAVFWRWASCHTSLEVFRALVEGSLK